MSRNHNDAADEIRGVMFAPDTLLPDQFASALRRKGFVEGEKRLVAAVLADAVECYMKHVGTTDRRNRQVFEDAEAWIFDEVPSGLLTFTEVCEVLNLEPDYVRAGLRTWRKRQPPAIDRSPDEEPAPLKAAG